MGPRTRETVGEYQKSKKVTVTKRTNAETVGKLGVEPESKGGEFKGAGHDSRGHGQGLVRDIHV